MLAAQASWYLFAVTILPGQNLAASMAPLSLLLESAAQHKSLQKIAITIQAEKDCGPLARPMALKLLRCFERLLLCNAVMRWAFQSHARA